MRATLKNITSDIPLHFPRLSISRIPSVYVFFIVSISVFESNPLHLGDRCVTWSFVQCLAVGPPGPVPDA